MNGWSRKLRLCAALLCAVMCVGLLAGCGSITVMPGETVACSAVSGNKSDTYALTGALTLDFSDADDARIEFNRFDLEYEISAPVRCVIRYESANGKNVNSS